MQERRSKPRRKGDNIAMSNEEIMKKLSEFIDRYEKDMRGDMNLGNGEKGLVGEVRAIKEYIKDYPTIAWQFKKSPVKVVGSVIGVFMVLMALYTAGLMELFAKIFGISLP